MVWRGKGEARGLRVSKGKALSVREEVEAVRVRVDAGERDGEPELEAETSLRESATLSKGGGEHEAELEWLLLMLRVGEWELLGERVAACTE